MKLKKQLDWLDILYIVCLGVLLFSVSIIEKFPIFKYIAFFTFIILLIWTLFYFIVEIYKSITQITKINDTNIDDMLVEIKENYIFLRRQNMDHISNNMVPIITILAGVIIFNNGKGALASIITILALMSFMVTSWEIYLGCFHPTPQKCKILKPSFLQT